MSGTGTNQAAAHYQPGMEVGRAPSRKPFIYVAGPISKDPFGCVRQATEVWPTLRRAGAVPFLPQLSIIHEIVAPLPYEEWMAYDFDVLEMADGLVRLPGESPGAEREIDHANTIGVPVHRYASLEGADADAQLFEWVWRLAHGTL